MPWCPKCKNEYQEGIEVCADCKIPLVAELPDEDDYETVAFISEEELAGKLVEYLEFSSIESECDFDENEGAFAVRVPAEKLEDAKVAFRAFYNVEKAKEAAAGLESSLSEDIPEVLDNLEEQDLSEDEKDILEKAIVSEQVYKPAEVYVKKSDVSKDMFSTAITFIVFAVALLILAVLSVTGVLTLFSGNIGAIIMMFVLAIGCCAVGINAINRSRRAEIASHEEDKLTDDINEWLKTNITDECFTELADSDLSEELLYLKRVEIIKRRLNEAFPGQNEDYVDALIDDFYDVKFPSEDAADDADNEDNADADDLDNADDTNAE